MSKIFEALNRGGGEIPDLILPSLSEGQVPEAEPVFGQIPSAMGDPAPVEKRPGPMAEPPAAPHSPGHIRVVPLRMRDSSPFLPFEENGGSASEQYRMIRTRIIQHSKQPRMIMISSAGPADGKTVTAVNLAGALSLKSGSNVLLLDGDFRRSAVHTALSLPEAPGMMDVLSGTCTLEEALSQAQQLANLYMISAGTPSSNPAELLDSSRWTDVCAKLRKLFRYIIVDSPPVSAVADYDLIQATSDGVILVARPDHTNRHLCLKALEMVPKEKFLGIVLNCVSPWFLMRRQSYYYYPGSGGY